MLNRILLVLVVFLCLINNLLPEVNAVSTTAMGGSGSGGNTGGGSGTGGNTGGGSGTGGNTGSGSGTGGNTGSGSSTGGNTGSGSSTGSSTGGNTGSGSGGNTGSGSGSSSGTGSVTTTQQQQSGSGNPTTTQQQQSGTGNVTTTQQQQSGSGNPTTTQGQQSGSGSGSGNPTTTQGQQSGSGSGSGNPTTTQGQQSGSGGQTGSGSGGQTGSSGSTTSPTTTSGGETTTTQGSSYTGFTNSICEKNSEPSGECSLLLQLEVETEFPITIEGQLFSIYKEAWRDIANIASNLGVGSISLYVEFLKFVVLNNTNNVYEYAYEVDVALFESSCSQVTTWFNIFSNYGSAFLTDINDFIASSSLNFTAIGLGDTIIVQGTLSERASDGTIKNETSFQTNSAENNYVSKNIFIMMGLAMVSLLML